MKDSLKNYKKAVQKYKDRNKPKTVPESLEKAKYGIASGKWEPEARDPEGMPHKDDPTRVKGTSSRPGKQPIWKYRSDIAKMQDEAAARNLSLAHQKMPQHTELLNKLYQKVIKDPDRHSVGDVFNRASQQVEHELRVRHLAHALIGKPGYSITPDQNGLVISAERHPAGKNIVKHSWHFNGKDLKFLGESPISKITGGDKHVTQNQSNMDGSKGHVLPQPGGKKITPMAKSDSHGESGVGEGDGWLGPWRNFYRSSNGSAFQGVSGFSGDVAISSVGSGAAVADVSDMGGIRRDINTDDLQKSVKDAKAMLPDAEHAPVIDWAYKTMPTDNWAMWFLRNYKKDPTIWNDKNKEDVSHFTGLAKITDSIKKHQFDPSHSYEDGIEALKGKERDWVKKQGPRLVDKKGKPIIDLGNGLAWWDLGVGQCEEEGNALGHCGNTGDPHRDDRILSLRQQKGNKYEPALTFIENHGWLGEMKGRANTKPAAKYHGAIKALLEHPTIDHIAGGGYAAESNFELNDLPAEEKAHILQKKPNLDPLSSEDPEELKSIQSKIAKGDIKLPPKHRGLEQDITQKIEWLNRSKQLGQNFHDHLVNNVLKDENIEESDHHLAYKLLTKTPERIQTLLSKGAPTAALLALTHPLAGNKQSVDHFLQNHEASTGWDAMDILSKHPSFDANHFKWLYQRDGATSELNSLLLDKPGLLSKRDIKDIVSGGPVPEGIKNRQAGWLKSLPAQNAFDQEAGDHVLHTMVSGDHNIASPNPTASSGASLFKGAMDVASPELVNQLYYKSPRHQLVLGGSKHASPDVIEDHAKRFSYILGNNSIPNLSKLSPDQTYNVFKHLSDNGNLNHYVAPLFPNQDKRTLMTTVHLASSDIHDIHTAQRIDGMIAKNRDLTDDELSVLSPKLQEYQSSINLLTHSGAGDKTWESVLRRAQHTPHALMAAVKHHPDMKEKIDSKRLHQLHDFITKDALPNQVMNQTSDIHYLYTHPKADRFLKEKIQNHPQLWSSVILEDKDRGGNPDISSDDIKNSLKSQHPGVVSAASLHPHTTVEDIEVAANNLHPMMPEPEKTKKRLQDTAAYMRDMQIKMKKSVNEYTESLLQKAYVNASLTPEDVSSTHNYTLDPSHAHSHIFSSKIGNHFHHVFESGGGRGLSNFYTHVLSTSDNPFDVNSHLGAMEAVKTDFHSPHGYEPAQVVSSNMKHVGQGHGKELYKAALGFHGHLVSDFQQSRGAHKLWTQELSSLPGTDFKLAVKPHETHEVWLKDPEFYLKHHNIDSLQKSNNTHERLMKMKWLHDLHNKKKKQQQNQKPEQKEAPKVEAQPTQQQPLPKPQKPTPKEPPVLDYSKMKMPTEKPESPDVGEYWKAPSVKHSDVVKQKQLQDKMIERHSKNPNVDIVQGKNKTMWVKGKGDMKKSDELDNQINGLKQKYDHTSKMPSYGDRAAHFRLRHGSLKKNVAPVAPGMDPGMGAPAAPMGQMAMPPLAKDNKPHPAGSPADSAHDVVEGEESLKSELKQQQSSQKRQQMMEHIKMLRHKKALRSKSNALTGKD